MFNTELVEHLHELINAAGPDYFFNFTQPVDQDGWQLQIARNEGGHIFYQRRFFSRLELLSFPGNPAGLVIQVTTALLESLKNSTLENSKQVDLIPYYADEPDPNPQDEIVRKMQGLGNSLIPDGPEIRNLTP
jgi:hypothetical protein